MEKTFFSERLVTELIGKSVTIVFTGDYGAAEHLRSPYSLTRTVKGHAWGFDPMIELEPEVGDGDSFLFFRGGTQVFLTDVKRVACDGEIVFDAGS